MSSRHAHFSSSAHIVCHSQLIYCIIRTQHQHELPRFLNKVRLQLFIWQRPENRHITTLLQSYYFYEIEIQKDKIYYSDSTLQGACPCLALSTSVMSRAVTTISMKYGVKTGVCGTLHPDNMLAAPLTSTAIYRQSKPTPHINAFCSCPIINVEMLSSKWMFVTEDVFPISFLHGNLCGG